MGVRWGDEAACWVWVFPLLTLFPPFGTVSSFTNKNKLFPRPIAAGPRDHRPEGLRGAL